MARQDKKKDKKSMNLGGDRPATLDPDYELQGRKDPRQKQFGRSGVEDLRSLAGIPGAARDFIIEDIAEPVADYFTGAPPRAQSRQIVPPQQGPKGEMDLSGIFPSNEDNVRNMLSKDVLFNASGQTPSGAPAPLPAVKPGDPDYPQPQEGSPVARAATEDMDPIEAMLRQRIEKGSQKQRREPGLMDYIALIAGGFAPGATVQSQMGAARAITGEDRERADDADVDSNIMRLLQLQNSRALSKQRGEASASRAAQSLEPKPSDIRASQRMSERDVDQQIQILAEDARQFGISPEERDQIQFKINKLIDARQRSRDRANESGQTSPYVDVLKIMTKPDANQ